MDLAPLSGIDIGDQNEVEVENVVVVPVVENVMLGVGAVEKEHLVLEIISRKNQLMKQQLKLEHQKTELPLFVSVKDIVVVLVSVPIAAGHGIVNEPAGLGVERDEVEASHVNVVEVTENLEQPTEAMSTSNRSSKMLLIMELELMELDITVTTSRQLASFPQQNTEPLIRLTTNPSYLHQQLL